MEPLVLPGTRASLESVAEYVLAAGAEAGLDRKSRYRLRLAVDEIATNVVTYGYERAQREGSLYLEARIDAATLSIVLEDTGPAYDPTAKGPPADLDLPPDERQVGGLGVFLAVRSVDRFQYERVGDRNRNTLTMQRPQSVSG